ncbi:hypothetical protein SAMN05414139_10284 [Burkholderia sp. D7]|nr:hypothetical protein SAMN05414139_10284 [Burkholderia sp. D7]
MPSRIGFMTAQDPTHWMALFGPILISESAMVNA